MFLCPFWSNKLGVPLPLPQLHHSPQLLSLQKSHSWLFLIPHTCLRPELPKTSQCVPDHPPSLRPKAIQCTTQSECPQLSQPPAPNLLLPKPSNFPSLLPQDLCCHTSLLRGQDPQTLIFQQWWLLSSTPLDPSPLLRPPANIYTHCNELPWLPESHHSPPQHLLPHHPTPLQGKDPALKTKISKT